MTESKKSLPKWILIITALFALIEVMVSIQLYFYPESLEDTVDLNAHGVDSVIKMWAVRQFALGFIFAFATWKRSIPMLLISYIFFLVMFAGDLIIGILQADRWLVIGAVIMCVISTGILFALNKHR